jgi:hypothetical protein
MLMALGVTAAPPAVVLPIGPDASAEDDAPLAAAEPALLGAGLMSPPTVRAVEPAPVYPTRLPPPFDFIYQMHRGPLSGRGQLSLTIKPEGYEARLSGSVAGLSIIDWISLGSFDAAGFAPQRFTDKRLRRAAKAANFEREANKITYSGPGKAYQLTPGAQDRLSWMVQLAAIAQADPKQLEPGRQIALFVTGARGDAAIWRLTVVAKEALVTPLGRVAAIRLLRQAEKARDTRAEIWLDPSRHYLPVKARLSTPNDGDSAALELLLEQATVGS